MTDEEPGVEVDMDGQPWTAAQSAPLEAGTTTLVEGSSFCLSLPSGDILRGHPHGFFARDTRFVSQWRLRVDGVWPEPLAAHRDDPFAATFVLQAAPESGRADSNLVVVRRRRIDDAMHEDVIVRNFGPRPARCRLTFDIDCDFADLFDVKHGQVHSHGAVTRVDDGDAVVFEHAHGRLHRATRIHFVGVTRTGPGPTFEAEIPPGREWVVRAEARPEIDGEHLGDRTATPRVAVADPEARLHAWREGLPRVSAERDSVARLLAGSVDDLAALRLADPGRPDRTVLAAGVPWFMTLFGRDSLLASWMALPVDPGLALHTLATLADLQGVDLDDRTEEQPGRILHEVRFGEAARLALGGGSIYYGSADATPLFVMLLAECRRWGADPASVEALLPAADRALAWVHEFGDRDADGYVEYFRASERGLRNQGWKDSWDAIHSDDGNLAEPPIALCEVQAYVYAAYLARRDLAVAAGDGATATDLAQRAAALKERFNRDFWLPDRRRYAVGLDRDKTPIDAPTSNVGHCLWAGIVDDDRAPAVAAQLLDDTSFTGWGIRTLATSAARFNPVSYHNGSVWPHDTVIAAAGLHRYGFHDEAARLADGMLRAARSFGDRLPELFAGFSRRDFSFPVRYPTSCSPQAWAAAAPFLLIRAAVGLEPDVPAGRVGFAPVPVPALGRLVVDGVRLGSGSVSFEYADGTVEVTGVSGGLSPEVH